MIYIQLLYKGCNGCPYFYAVFNKLGMHASSHAMVAYRFYYKQNNVDDETKYIYLKTKGDIGSFVATDENGQQQNVQYIACTNTLIRYLFSTKN